MRPRERAPAPELIPYVVAVPAKFVRKQRLDGQEGKAFFVARVNFPDHCGFVVCVALMNLS
jgi:hypothetical protein